MFQSNNNNCSTTLDKPPRPRLKRSMSAPTAKKPSSSQVFNYKKKYVKLQLTEQVKCLDSYLEAQVALLADLSEFYRRRGEVEMDYAKNLERLADRFVVKHKSAIQRRDSHILSPYACWYQLLATTKRESRDHAILSEVLTTNVAQRYTMISDDIQKSSKKCREVSLACHEELMNVLSELLQTIKVYHGCHTEYKQSESKMKQAESDRQKALDNQTRKGTNKNLKNFDRNLEKKLTKYDESRHKCMRSRNDYLLCLNAANSALHKYYINDVSDLIDNMNLGYHTNLSKAMKAHLSAESSVQVSKHEGMKSISVCIEQLNQRNDKQKLLDAHHSTFNPPPKFSFMPHGGDDVKTVLSDELCQAELADRNDQFHMRLNELRAEKDEVMKTLQATEQTIQEMCSQRDYDMSAVFSEDKSVDAGHLTIKKRSDEAGTSSFYLAKFAEYTKVSNLYVRLKARHDLLHKALENVCAVSGVGLNTQRRAGRPVSIHKNKNNKQTRPVSKLGVRLFGGRLIDYIEATGQDVPAVVQSCTRFISTFGLHHQGIFRVPGSRSELKELKAIFERGYDPLAEATEKGDINTVADCLKAFFRELEEPVFPPQLFDEFVETIINREGVSDEEFFIQLNCLISRIPYTIMVVIRYMLSFLHHLSQFSDENMMDAYNLAICFGPTLMPVPDGKDMVVNQNHVIELMKIFIVNWDMLFPTDDSSTMYEQYSNDDMSEERSGSISEEGALSASDDELELSQTCREVSAKFDYSAKSNGELTFREGDKMLLHHRESDGYWWASLDGQYGLIPDHSFRVKHTERLRTPSTPIFPDSDKLSICSVKVKRSTSDRLSTELSSLKRHSLADPSHTTSNHHPTTPPVVSSIPVRAATPSREGPAPQPDPPQSPVDKSPSPTVDGDSVKSVPQSDKTTQSITFTSTQSFPLLSKTAVPSTSPCSTFITPTVPCDSIGTQSTPANSISTPDLVLDLPITVSAQFTCDTSTTSNGGLTPTTLLSQPHLQHPPRPSSVGGTSPILNRSQSLRSPGSISNPSLLIHPAATRPKVLPTGPPPPLKPKPKSKPKISAGDSRTPDTPPEGNVSVLHSFTTSLSDKTDIV